MQLRERRDRAATAQTTHHWHGQTIRSRCSYEVAVHTTVLMPAPNRLSQGSQSCHSHSVESYHLAVCALILLQHHAPRSMAHHSSRWQIPFRFPDRLPGPVDRPDDFPAHPRRVAGLHHGKMLTGISVKLAGYQPGHVAPRPTMASWESK